MQPTKHVPTSTSVQQAEPGAYRVIPHNDPSKTPIYLTPLAYSDAIDLVNVINQQADSALLDNVRSFHVPFTLADAHTYISKYHQVTVLGGRFFSVRLGSPTAPIVGGYGWIAKALPRDGISPLGACPYIEWAIGAWVVSAVRDQGIVAKCVSETMRRASDDGRVARVVADCFVENIASRRVLKKCGFQMEGVVRGAAVKEGRLRDNCQLAWNPPVWAGPGGEMVKARL
ncbi:acyl-CoA N-acyltransferase [Catenaria anguillulae PL171]|uniref:Acyl-CoA N-acyltransferase n=1 Tax=Catenaria anguillulae PL171 TaxID=765915 RepID=A0A1Y2HBT9_9FUNG|nr:acyl-CoA N-acyltransferase [Catenaria anguillulae PL171]